MPILLPPLTFLCRTCTWKHTTWGPVGDVRLPGYSHFDACPRCDGKVESRIATRLERWSRRWKKR